MTGARLECTGPRIIVPALFVPKFRAEPGSSWVRYILPDVSHRYFGSGVTGDYSPEQVAALAETVDRMRPGMLAEIVRMEFRRESPSPSIGRARLSSVTRIVMPFGVLHVQNFQTLKRAEEAA